MGTTSKFGVNTFSQNFLNVEVNGSTDFVDSMLVGSAPLPASTYAKAAS